MRNTCHAPNDTRSDATFQITTTANAQQQRALDLAQAIHMRKSLEKLGVRSCIKTSVVVV